MNLVRKLEAIGEEIADIASSIYVKSKEVEIHEQSAAEYHAAAAEFRQHGDGADLPPKIRHGLDIAERMAIEGRAEVARLKKRLADAREAFIRASPAPLTASRLVDDVIETAIGNQP